MIKCVMKTLSIIIILFSATSAMADICPGGTENCIDMVTGPVTGTYIKFGQQIAEIAKDAGLHVLVKESEGSLDNIKRIVSSENAGSGIVQSDVLSYLVIYKEKPEMRFIAELRLIFPLYNEEVHLFARKEIVRFEDLQDKRVVIGKEGSGNRVTAMNLLKMMGIKPAEYLEWSPVIAIKAVLRGEADAMFYVVGKPASVFTNFEKLKKEPAYAPLVDGVHFVPLNHSKMLKEYVSSEISSSDYAWVDKTIPTIAVKAVFITYDFFSRRDKDSYYEKRCRQLYQLSQAMINNIKRIQDEIKTALAKNEEPKWHRKWLEVNLDEESGIWERDPCSHPHSVTPARTKSDPHSDILTNGKEKYPETTP